MYYMFYTNGKVAMNAAWKNPNVLDEVYVCYIGAGVLIKGIVGYWMVYKNKQLLRIDDDVVPGIYKAKLLLLRK